MNEANKVCAEFLVFCGDHLGQSKGIIKLVKKRFKDCNPDFLADKTFLELVKNTQEKIKSDTSRIFVHLKCFLNELKQHKQDNLLTNVSTASSNPNNQLHHQSRKGTKRPADSDLAHEHGVKLKHPRHEELIDLSADDEYDSYDSGNELPKLIRRPPHKHNTKIDKDSACNDEVQNHAQNWRDVRLKKSVMGSIEAAANSFSSRLSKTISKVKPLHITTPDSNSDSIKEDTVSFSGVSSSSRTPSPLLGVNVSCKSFESESPKNGVQSQQSKTDVDKHDEAIEIIGSPEISSTTSNLDSDTEGCSKKDRNISRQISASNYSREVVENRICLTEKAKNSADSDVKLSDLADINGYTVEMNVSSDNDDGDFDNDVQLYEDIENGVDSQENSTDHMDEKTADRSDIVSGSNKRNLNSEKVLDEPLIKLNGTSFSSKQYPTQENVILLETDDESMPSDTEDKTSTVIEPGLNKSRNTVDLLFEGSDSEAGVVKHGANTGYSKDITSRDSGTSGKTDIAENDKNSSCLRDEKSALTGSIHTSEEHSKTDEEQEFPSFLGLVSVSKLKKDCEKKCLVSVEKLDKKTEEKYTDAVPSTSKDNANDGQHNSKTEKKGSKRQIQKYEKLLERIRDEIEALRERELSLDDLDDYSAYTDECDLKEKFVKVFKKLCEIHKAETTTGRPVEKFFKYEGTRYPEVNKKISRFINRRREFPDYSDIRKLIVRVNKANGLGLRGKAIDGLAREAFIDVGNRLQRRRHEDFMATFSRPFNAPISEYDDPALLDPELKRKLEANKKVAKTKMDAVVEKYTQLQNKIGDQENSDSEEDEESNEDREPPEKLESDGEDDLIVIEEGDPVIIEGLGKISRADRTPLLMESSQLEIVTDEVEDIAPYFAETQIDDIASPASDVKNSIKPKHQAYENETVLQSDEENVTTNKSENSLSPDALAIFNECDEIEIVTDYSDSEEEPSKDLDPQSFKNTKVVTETAEDEDKYSSFNERKETESKKQTKTLNETSVITQKEDPNQTKVFGNPNSHDCSSFGLKSTKQDKVVKQIDEDLHDLVQQINTDYSNSDGDSDVEVRDVENILESDKSTCVTGINKNAKTQGHTTWKGAFSADTKTDAKQSQVVASDKIVNQIAASEILSDEGKTEVQNSALSFDKSKTKKEAYAFTGNKTQTVSPKPESPSHGNFRDLEIHKADEAVNHSIHTVLKMPGTLKSDTAADDEIFTGNKLKSQVIVIDEDHIKEIERNRSESPCIVIDSTEAVPANDMKLEKIRTKNVSGNLFAHSVTIKTKHVEESVQTTEDNDSDIEIILEENNINDDGYHADRLSSEEKDSQGSYFDDNSSKNLNYDEASYAENSTDWDEADDYPLDTTSSGAYTNENSGQNDKYDNEITSTLTDTFDIKVPRRGIKDNIKAAHVTLKRPTARKQIVNPATSLKTEENLDLIEIYDEPHSTAYVDDMVVSSSGQNEAIVLLDSE